MKQIWAMKRDYLLKNSTKTQHTLIPLFVSWKPSLFPLFFLSSPNQNLNSHLQLSPPNRPPPLSSPFIYILFVYIHTESEWEREREEWIRIKASFSSVGFHGIRRRTSSRSISVTTTTFWALPSCGRRTLGSQGASVSSFLRILTF